MNASTAGFSGTTPNAGGSLTVSDASDRAARRREQRHDAAVGMADEMVALAQLRSDLVGLLLEVDPLDAAARGG